MTSQANILLAVRDEASATLSKVDSKLRDIGDTAKTSTTHTSAMGSALKSVGQIAAGFVVARGLMELPNLLKGVVTAASDLNESMSKSQVVFGQSNDLILQFASNSSKSLGMSKQATIEATATFGNFLTAMGQTVPVAADMSMGMVKLAADLASFNNASPEEVLLALRSGLSGEAEPMRRFGVALSETAVQAKAAQMGLGGLGRELTDQEKIAARYAIIMDQTKTAQGDFARTSDGLANRQRILAAQFKDLQTQIGQLLLPVFVSLAGFLVNTLLPSLSGVGETIKGLAGKVDLGGLGDLHGALKDVGDAAGEAGRLLATLASNEAFVFREAERFVKEHHLAQTALLGMKTQLQAVALAFKGLSAVIAIVNGFLREHPAVAKAVGIAMAAVMAPLTGAVGGFIAVSLAIGKVREVLPALRDAVESAMTSVRDTVSSAVATVIAAFNSVVTFVTGLPGSILEAVTSGFNAVVAFLAGIPGAVVGALSSMGEAAFTAVTGALQSLLDWILATFTAEKIGYAIGRAIFAPIEAGRLVITEAIPAIATAAVALGTAIVKGIASGVSAAWGAVTTFFTSTLPGLLASSASSGATAGTGIGRAIIEAMADAISSAWHAVETFFGSTVPNFITSTIPAAVSAAASLGGQIVSSIASAISGAASSLPGAISSLMSQIWLAAEGVAREFFDIGQRIVYGIKDGIWSLADWLWNQAYNFAKGILKAAKDALDVSSPSKQGMYIGQMFVAGIAKGMQEMKNLSVEMPGLQAASYTPTVSASALRPADLAMGSGGGGGVVNVNLNSPTFFGQFDLTMKRQIAEAVRDVHRGGGFRGIPIGGS